MSAEAVAQACHLRRRLDPPGDLAGRHPEHAGARIDYRLMGPDCQQGLHVANRPAPIKIQCKSKVGYGANAQVDQEINCLSFRFGCFVQAPMEILNPGQRAGRLLFSHRVSCISYLESGMGVAAGGAGVGVDVGRGAGVGVRGA